MAGGVLWLLDLRRGKGYEYAPKIIGWAQSSELTRRGICYVGCDEDCALKLPRNQSGMYPMNAILKRKYMGLPGLERYEGKTGQQQI